MYLAINTVHFLQKEPKTICYRNGTEFLVVFNIPLFLFEKRFYKNM